MGILGILGLLGLLEKFDSSASVEGAGSEAGILELGILPVDVAVAWGAVEGELDEVRVVSGEAEEAAEGPGMPRISN